MLLESTIPGLNLSARGKVRDIYDLGDTLLIVTSDRISAFDFVMPNGIPNKGRVLTLLSEHWFRETRSTLANHLITTDVGYIAAKLEKAGAAVSDALLADLAGRTMLAVKAEVFPVECVVRGYLAGSLWGEYRRAGGEERDVMLHGIPLPAGLRESDRLPEPLFTPSTKATTGHDQNIGYAEMAQIVGDECAAALRDASLSIYSAAAAAALVRGIIIADTKFEFGMHRGVLTLVDEALTPDSSRFWDSALYQPGQSQPSFDKQYLRDWLTNSGWNREPPAPALPADVVAATARRYAEAFERITGKALPTT